METLMVKTDQMKISSKQKYLRVYAGETSNKDIVGDEHFLEMIAAEFGRRVIRGTALSYECPVTHIVSSAEKLLRKIFNDMNIKTAFEIGTFRGVSTALLAHYADKVITLDVKYFEEAMYLWAYAGVMEKIEYIVTIDENKKEVINGIDFDFVFIDGHHDYESVKKDFELTKKCGRVLFHDYLSTCSGVIKFVDSLPKNEIVIKRPFAYWERNGNSPS